MRSRFLVSRWRALACGLTLFLVSARAEADEPPGEKKNAGTLLRQLGFTNVSVVTRKVLFGVPKVEGRFNGQPVTAVLGLERLGTVWLRKPEDYSGSQQGLEFGSFRLADISPRETGLPAYWETEVLLGAAVLGRYSAIYLPALGQLYLRENPLSPEDAAGLQGVWLRSGFEKHSFERAGDGPVIAGMINGHPAKFRVNLRSPATMLNVNRAKEFGFKPVSVNWPATTFSRIGQPFRVTVRSGNKSSEQEALKDARIDRLDFGGTQVVAGRFLLSGRLFEEDTKDASQEPLAGRIGLDLLAQAGAVVDFRGDAIFLLKGEMGAPGTKKKPARK